MNDLVNNPSRVLSIVCQAGIMGLGIAVAMMGSFPMGIAIGGIGLAWAAFSQSYASINSVLMHPLTVRAEPQRGVTGR